EAMRRASAAYRARSPAGIGMRRLRIWIGVVSAVAVGLVGGTFGAAFASAPGGAGDAVDSGGSVEIQQLPGGDWPVLEESWPGTTVEFRGDPGFRGLVEDRGLGTRLESRVQIRQIGSSSDVRGV